MKRFSVIVLIAVVGWLAVAAIFYLAMDLAGYHLDFLS